MFSSLKFVYFSYNLNILLLYFLLNSIEVHILYFLINNILAFKYIEIKCKKIKYIYHKLYFNIINV